MDGFRNLFRRRHGRNSSKETKSLSNRAAGLNRSPALMEVDGLVRISGGVKVEWIEDVLKRLALVVACQLLYPRPNWHPIIPFLAKSLYNTLKSRAAILKDAKSRMSSELQCVVNGKFITALSYVEKGSKRFEQSCSHSWEFETMSHQAVVIHFKLHVRVELTRFEDRDSSFMNHFILLNPINHEWDHICAQLVDHFSTANFDPDEALKLMVPDSKGLKKLVQLSELCLVPMVPSAPPPPDLLVVEGEKPPSKIRRKIDFYKRAIGINSSNSDAESFNSRDEL